MKKEKHGIVHGIVLCWLCAYSVCVTQIFLNKEFMNFSNIILDVLLALCGAYWLNSARNKRERCFSIFMAVGLLSIAVADCLSMMLR